MYLRPATMEDSDNLLAWRNDEITMLNSRQDKPIPPKRHAVWMSINVKFGYPSRIVLIAELDNGTPVGVVDFSAADPFMEIYEVGITIAPNMRGRGYGFAALALGCQRMKKKVLKAEIKRTNIASRRIFEKCEFDVIKRDQGFIFFRKDPK